MSSSGFLLWSSVALACAAAAWWPARRLGPLNPLYFAAGWLAGELALQWVALHALVTVAFASAGALSDTTGVLGLCLNFAACGFLIACHLRSIRGAEAVATLAAAARWDPPPLVSPTHGFALPFRLKASGVRRIRDIEYGDVLPGDKGGRNLLDVVLPEASGELRPALLQIHGGAWIIGDKQHQGGPLMAHLASRGWVCFAMNYRLAPRAKFPDAIVDVKRAIAWIRAHADEYGVDPDFLCLSGGSAGGHLSALAALSPNDPAFQPGFENRDTRIAAAVPFYGVYDFLDRAGVRGWQSMAPFLARLVFQCQPTENPELWDSMSPINHVSAEAPPFLVIHGTHDSLAFVEEGREFVRALLEKSRAPVHMLEMTGGQHAFELFHSVRCAQAVRAATAFLQTVHAQYSARPSSLTGPSS